MASQRASLSNGFGSGAAPRGTGGPDARDLGSTAEKFFALRSVKEQRQAEEALFSKLRSKVSLLQKEEQRVLNKIMCIGALKNRIHEVKRLNEDYRLQMQKKQAEDARLLEEKREKNAQIRQDIREGRRSRSRVHDDVKAALRESKRREKEAFAHLRQRHLAENQTRAGKLAENLRLNHEITAQVAEWEKEARVGRRLDRQRAAEERALAELRNSNSHLREQKAVELEVLMTEQLIQERLFDELKKVILSG